MTADRDPFNALRDALEVVPSLGFAARVRARVRSTGERPRRVWLAAPAAVGALVLAVVMWPRAVSEPPIPSVETTLGSAEVATYQARFAAAASGPAEPEAAAGRSPARVASVRPAALDTPVAHSRIAVAASVPDATRTGRLDVVTDQGVLLRRLWAAQRSWNVAESAAAETRPGPVDAVPALPSTLIVPPLIVEPIVVVDVVVRIGTDVRLPAPPSVVARDATRSHQ